MIFDVVIVERTWLQCRTNYLFSFYFQRVFLFVDIVLFRCYYVDEIDQVKLFFMCWCERRREWVSFLRPQILSITIFIDYDPYFDVTL
jgi:hypothetical protein